MAGVSRLIVPWTSDYALRRSLGASVLCDSLSGIGSTHFRLLSMLPPPQKSSLQFDATSYLAHLQTGMSRSLLLQHLSPRATQLTESASVHFMSRIDTHVSHPLRLLKMHHFHFSCARP